MPKTSEGSKKRYSPFEDAATGEQLARRYGTPLYVYSGTRLDDRLTALRAAFPEKDFDANFAVKANGNPNLLRRIFAAGFGADVVSAGELAIARRAGCPVKRISFSGVGKTDAELTAALRARIGAVHLESAEEAKRLGEIAKKAKQIVRVGIRINPEVTAVTHAKLATGHSAAKFGVPPDQALKILESLPKSLKFEGASCHIGSQIFDTAPFRKAAEVVRSFLEEAGRRGFDSHFADLGGGFGVPYRDEAELDLADFAKALRGAFLGTKWRLSVDPGRWIVAPVGALLTSVLAVKTVGTKTFVVVDAGQTELLRPALYDAWHRIESADVGPAALRADVVGPVCESGDILGENRALPSLRRGSLLWVETCGAYGYSMASTYNARPRPAEVLIEGGRTEVLRARERIGILR